VLRVLTTDFMKIRRKLIWFLVFLGPFGVIALQAANFGIRYDYLTNLYADNLWEGLIHDVQSLAIPTLLLGLSIITSMLANIEHQTNAWKQLLALPITKRSVFISKLALALFLLFLSSSLLGIGTILLGLALKFGTDIPFLYLLKMMYYPYLAVFPFIAFQIWIAISLKNQAIPLTVGIISTVLSMNSSQLNDWLPWKWPSLQNGWGDPIYSVIAGLLLGLVIFMMGLLDFVRKDVK